MENDLYHLIQEFIANVSDVVNQKEYFPYEHQVNFEKFNKGLPRKNKFYDTLTKHAVSVKNYEHVPEVSKAFQKKTIKGYHNLLLNVTFFSLVCVFKTFRKESINYFELDPAHY